MDNSHIFTIIKEEVKLDSRRICYPDNYPDGMDLIARAGAKFKAEVETPGRPNRAGRVRAEGVRLIVSTIRFLRHLT